MDSIVLTVREIVFGYALKMADFRYKCDKCDEAFNLNIKLKKHILAAHGQTLEAEDDLSKEEKIKLFDLVLNFPSSSTQNHAESSGIDPK